MLQSLYRHQNNCKSTQWCVWCIPLFLVFHSVTCAVGKERNGGVGGKTGGGRWGRGGGGGGGELGI